MCAEYEFRRGKYVGIERKRKDVMNVDSSFFGDRLRTVCDSDSVCDNDGDSLRTTNSTKQMDKLEIIDV